MLVECNGRKVECWMFSWECVAVCKCAKWYVLFIFLLFFFCFLAFVQLKHFRFISTCFTNWNSVFWRDFFLWERKKVCYGGFAKSCLGKGSSYRVRTERTREFKMKKAKEFGNARRRKTGGNGSNFGTVYSRKKKQQCTGT